MLSSPEVGTRRMTLRLSASGGMFPGVLLIALADTISDDETFPKDGAYARWSDTLDEAFKKINRPWFTGPELKDLFEAAGFVNVQVQLLKRPNNDWPKDPKMKEMGRVSSHPRIPTSCFD